MAKLKGWSTRGRPFSPKEYMRSFLKSNTRMSYGTYLTNFGRQWRSPKLRRMLLKKNI